MNVLDEIDAAVQASTARRQRLAQAQAEAAERRFTDEIPGVVRVTVNGAGELLDIELAPGCLGRQTHLLGGQITRTVANARRQAAVAGREALTEVLGERAANWLTGSEEPKPVRRGQSVRPGDSDAYFEDKFTTGFLKEEPW